MGEIPERAEDGSDDCCNDCCDCNVAPCNPCGSCKIILKERHDARQER